MSNIIKVKTMYDTLTGRLTGEHIEKTVRKLDDVKDMFKDQKVLETMNLNQIVYEVESDLSVEQGKEGGLFFGTSYVYPGKVGNEYFMTKGHFHSKRDTAEYYWCIEGEGILLLMSEDGKISAEKLIKGSLHYIPGKVAHRVVNVGSEILVIGACWPSDAGHDYEVIAKNGFGVKVIEEDGKVVIREG